MKTVTKFPLFAIVAASSVCTVALGQSKFHRWLRERIGEREAADAKQAVADAQWQKKHLGDAASQQRLISRPG